MTSKSSAKKVSFHIGRGDVAQFIFDEFDNIRKELNYPKNEEFWRGVLTILKEETNYEKLKRIFQKREGDGRKFSMSPPPPPRKVSLVSLVPGSSFDAQTSISNISTFGNSASVVVCKNDTEKQKYLLQKNCDTKIKVEEQY